MGMFFRRKNKRKWKIKYFLLCFALYQTLTKEYKVPHRILKMILLKGVDMFSLLFFPSSLGSLELKSFCVSLAACQVKSSWAMCLSTFFCLFPLLMNYAIEGVFRVCLCSLLKRAEDWEVFGGVLTFSIHGLVWVLNSIYIIRVCYFIIKSRLTFVLIK